MKIEEYSFGRIVIDGKPYTKDVKIIKGQVIPEWWRESGHVLQYQDIEDIVEARPHTLIVGTGSPGRLKIEPELPNVLAEMGIRVETLPSSLAMERFNELIELHGTDKVAGAFHLTC